MVRQLYEAEQSEKVVADRPFVVLSLQQFSKRVLVSHEKSVFVINEQAIIEKGQFLLEIVQIVELIDLKVKLERWIDLQNVFMFAEPVHLFQKGLRLHLNRLGHCLPHTQQYPHTLILQIQTSYVSPQGEVHAFLHE